jgi:hypothetical protein
MGGILRSSAQHLCTSVNAGSWIMSRRDHLADGSNLCYEDLRRFCGPNSSYRSTSIAPPGSPGRRNQAIEGMMQHAAHLPDTQRYT